MSVLLRDVEVHGTRIDVLIRDGEIAEMGARLDGDLVIEGRGGALLPGLHDHHLHLMALAAASESVDCSKGLESLRHAPVHHGWIRGVRLGADLDRHAIDAVRPDVPVRLQHRSGGLWVLNTLALRAVAHVLDDSSDVERDSAGAATGRLWRYDERLRAGVPTAEPDLGAVVEVLQGYGITEVTDATPDLDADAVRTLSTLAGIRVTLLGGPSGTRKLLLRDHDLPTFAELRATVSDAHADGRPVAVHCVTRESLLLTLAVLDEVHPMPGDRIEHASVVPHGVAQEIARLGLAVVTQPGFIADRGDRYLSEVGAADRGLLYPFASLVAAGVPVAASSDAPFGPLDPWTVIRAATERVTASGARVTPDERVSPLDALAGYLSPPEAIGTPRRLRIGVRADLCLLDSPLSEALPDPRHQRVRGVIVGGVPTPGLV